LIADPSGRAFAVENAEGKIVELIPEGALIPVTEDRADEFKRKCVKLRLRELERPLRALRNGFTQLFPRTTAQFLMPWELELFVCGPADMPIPEKRKHINVEQTGHAEMLWRVLEGFSPEERRGFIKFGSGRTALPSPGRNLGSKLQVRF
jgi:hypothetical protein